MKPKLIIRMALEHLLPLLQSGKFFERFPEASGANFYGSPTVWEKYWGQVVRWLRQRPEGFVAHLDFYPWDSYAQHGSTYSPIEDQDLREIIDRVTDTEILHVLAPQDRLLYGPGDMGEWWHVSDEGTKAQVTARILETIAFMLHLGLPPEQLVVAPAPPYWKDWKHGPEMKYVYARTQLAYDIAKVCVDAGMSLQANVLGNKRKWDAWEAWDEGLTNDACELACLELAPEDRRILQCGVPGAGNPYTPEVAAEMMRWLDDFPAERVEVLGYADKYAEVGKAWREKYGEAEESQHD